MRLSQRGCMSFLMIVWLAAGGLLFYLGWARLLGPQVVSIWWIKLQGHFGREHTTLLYLLLGIVLGQLKGRLALCRVANRFVAKIRSWPESASLLEFFKIRECLLTLVMAVMGSLLRLLSLPDDVRGVILLAVGGALLQGGVHIYRRMRETQSLLEQNETVDGSL